MLQLADLVVARLHRLVATLHEIVGFTVQIAALQRGLPLFFQIVLAALDLVDDRLLVAASDHRLQVLEALVRLAEERAGLFGIATQATNLFAKLAESDADVISVPAAFTVPTGKAHWHVLLRARAIEAGLFVVAAAQVGHHEDGRNTFGHSLVVDPWGEILLDMGEEKGVGFTDIDLKRISDVRSRVPALNHRRPIPDVVTL